MTNEVCVPLILCSSLFSISEWVLWNTKKKYQLLYTLAFPPAYHISLFCYLYSVFLIILNILILMHYSSCLLRLTLYSLWLFFLLSLTPRYIPPDKREENDQSTHKWMVYVRGSRREPSIDHFVKKVWFFLHPSYKPNDLVEVRFVPLFFSAYIWDRKSVCEYHLVMHTFSDLGRAPLLL